MCLMCNALIKELVEEHQEERLLSNALSNMLRDTERLAREAGVQLSPEEHEYSEEMEDPCIECERQEADDAAFGFFCSKECMDTYDARVRAELRAESIRPHTKRRRTVWDHPDRPRPTLDEVLRIEFERVPSHLRV